MISTSRVDEDGRAQRRTGGPGGSAQTIPSRRRAVSRKSSPIDRARETLGEETVRQLQQTYRSLDSTWSEHDQAEGMVLSLSRQGVADAQIRAIFGVGGSMIQRLKGVIKNGIDTLHTRHRGTTPKHAFSEDDISFFISSCADWELEDGFPCSHRRPRQYFVEPKITWKLLWERYKKKAEDAERRVIQYCRWTQYVHLHYSGVRLSRTKEDFCEETTSDATKGQDRVTTRKAAPGAQPPAKKPVKRPQKVQPGLRIHLYSVSSNQDK
ncbi:hypothetical protein AM588_10003500 [Phytophthora nicotianae]|uniref:Uncharacterized protein n=1 Tax=Phytophthora nicotianae TaxID=4792 RepID=A0A0W8D753_PHYNI|nr:hypothetical protein AM588_10003500 [Phytophthora nicotianae]